MLGNKTGFVQINLDLRTPASNSLRVLYKVLMAVSLAIQMARLWRGVPRTRRAGRLQQLGSSPDVSIACGIEDGISTTYFPLCDLY